MPYATDLADICRSAGVPYIELSGWQTRGRSAWSAKAIILHDTVTKPTVPDANVDRILRDGHSTLAGPLSQYGCRRDGTFVVVAAGKCNHNGYGSFGNDAIGIEVYCAGGSDESWTQAQRTNVAKVCAEIQRRRGPLPILGHKESDPGRKIDPASVDMNAFRKSVTPPPPPTPQEHRKMVQDIIGFHTAYFSAIPGTPSWTKEIVDSVNYHLWRLASGQANIEVIRQDFARTTGR